MGFVLPEPRFWRMKCAVWRMLLSPNVVAVIRRLLFVGWLLVYFQAASQSVPTNLTVRVMSANLNGNVQSYQPFALRIFEGLKPDIVAIKEFNYQNNTSDDFRVILPSAAWRLE
jgi:hypothetical protein